MGGIGRALGVTPGSLPQKWEGTRGGRAGGQEDLGKGLAVDERRAAQAPSLHPASTQALLPAGASEGFTSTAPNFPSDPLPWSLSGTSSSKPPLYALKLT